MVKKVYDSIIDEKSKKIYINRLLNYITGDARYFLEIIKLSEDDKETEMPKISECYDEFIKKGTQYVVWGAASSGEVRYRFNKMLGYDCIKYFVDSNEELQKTGKFDKQVLSPKEFLEKWDGEAVLIESLYYEQEIAEEINRFFNGNCKIINHLNCNQQYFDEIICFSDDEVFLDCGCFDCGTTNDFINKVNGKYNRIIAFEPDKINYKNCIRIVENNKWENVEIINKGLWDKETTICFITRNDASSRVVEGSSLDEIEEELLDNNVAAVEKIDVVDIDSIIGDEKVTFIKMDIEGSELNALKGAEKAIKRNKPKLAICIYHKPEDIVEIPMYLKAIVPEYKFKIRHYTDNTYETVLYAIAD